MKSKSIILILATLLLISCQPELDLTPGHYVGRYSLSTSPTETDSIISEVNNRSTIPMGNRGVVFKWENQESTDTLAHYEILGSAYHIYNWNTRYNKGYKITHKDSDSFHLEADDGTKLYFNKRQ